MHVHMATFRCENISENDLQLQWNGPVQFLHCPVLLMVAKLNKQLWTDHRRCPVESSSETAASASPEIHNGRDATMKLPFSLFRDWRPSEVTDYEDYYTTQRRQQTEMGLKMITTLSLCCDGHPWVKLSLQLYVSALHCTWPIIRPPWIVGGGNCANVSFTW